MLDYLPRKVTLSTEEIEAFPAVLTAWVRFVLIKRGLEEPFVDEAAQAVDDCAEEFREAMADKGNFGPGKSLFQGAHLPTASMCWTRTSHGPWLRDFNARPEEERLGFFGRLGHKD